MITESVSGTIFIEHSHANYYICISHLSGVEAAHVASLLGSKGTVFVFNIPLAQVKNMEEKLSSLELTSELPILLAS